MTLTIQRWNGTILRRAAYGSLIAGAEACCCAEECLCQVPPQISENLILTPSEESIDGCPSQMSMSWLGGLGSTWWDYHGYPDCGGWYLVVNLFCAPNANFPWCEGQVDGKYYLSVSVTTDDDPPETYTGCFAMTCVSDSPWQITGTVNIPELGFSFSVLIEEA